MNRRPRSALATAIVLGGLVLGGCAASDASDDGAGSAVAATRETPTAQDVRTSAPAPAKDRVAPTRGELEMRFTPHPFHRHIQ